MIFLRTALEKLFPREKLTLSEGQSGSARIVVTPRENIEPSSDKPRLWLQISLFLLTILTTTWAGAAQAGVDLMSEPSRFAVGLPFSIGLLAILSAHELGHYFAARCHGMIVSLPYFIPNISSRPTVYISNAMDAPSNFSLGFAQRFSQELKCSGSVSDDRRRNTTSLKWSNRGRNDMSPFSFTLTLLLLGTIGAAQTDYSMFWLLIGPAPFAVVLTGLVFFRQGFSPRRMGKPLR